MSRRSFLLALGIFSLAALGVGAVLLLLVRHEPRRYAEATLPTGQERLRCSEAFSSEAFELWSATQRDREWSGRFTEEQINSYLSEGFIHQGLAERLVPDSITEPRVTIEPERLRLAFRYGSGFWSTVVSIDMRVWLSELQPNVVAVQLLALHAGALPISSQFLLERISEVARQNGMEVTWYRYDSYPVAIVRFQPDQPRSTLQLQSLHLEQGALTVRGKSTESGVIPAVLRTQ